MKQKQSSVTMVVPHYTTELCTFMWTHPQPQALSLFWQWVGQSPWIRGGLWCTMSLQCLCWVEMLNGWLLNHDHECQVKHQLRLNNLFQLGMAHVSEGETMKVTCPLQNDRIFWGATRVVLNDKLEIGYHHSQGSIGLDTGEWFVHVVGEIVDVHVLANAVGEGSDDTIKAQQEWFISRWWLHDNRFSFILNVSEPAEWIK